jgi:hypothetical protein
MILAFGVLAKSSAASRSRSANVKCRRRRRGIVRRVDDYAVRTKNEVRKLSPEIESGIRRMRRDERIETGGYVDRLAGLTVVEELPNERTRGKIARRHDAIRGIHVDVDRERHGSDTARQYEVELSVSDRLGELRDVEFQNAAMFFGESVDRLERWADHVRYGIPDPIVVDVEDEGPRKPLKRDVERDDFRLAVRAEPHPGSARVWLSDETIAVRQMGVDSR